MKERSILFNSDMVRAILDGRKTQTRRVIKDVPSWVTSFGKSFFTPLSPSGPWLQVSGRGNHPEYGPAESFFRFPYGKLGTRLWVRETFNPNWYGKVIYKADFPYGFIKDGQNPSWKPSIHMFRKASRITLEITGIRIERLKDITEEDAIAEGAPRIPEHEPPIHGRFRCGHFDLESGEVLNPPAYRAEFGEFDPHRFMFCRLWDSINEKRGFGWNTNPWCWVIEFKRI